MRVVPISLAQANLYVAAIHRHNGPLPGAKFAVAAVAGNGSVLGVAIAGIPKARMLNDGGTLEINRVATDGSRNVCSLLYGACLRAGKAMGYQRAITYTFEEEPGASLRASGWTLVAEQVGGAKWTHHKGQKTVRIRDAQMKSRWEVRWADPVTVVWPTVTESEVTLFDVDAMMGAQ